MILTAANLRSVSLDGFLDSNPTTKVMPDFPQLRQIVFQPVHFGANHCLGALVRKAPRLRQLRLFSLNRTLESLNFVRLAVADAQHFPHLHELYIDTDFIAAFSDQQRINLAGCFPNLRTLSIAPAALQGVPDINLVNLPLDLMHLELHYHQARHNKRGQDFERILSHLRERRWLPHLHTLQINGISKSMEGIRAELRSAGTERGVSVKLFTD